MTLPWVRIVIVNFNAGEYLSRVIAGLAAQTETDFEVVVVDNGSTDGSLESLDLPDGRFRILATGRNLGFAAGCNLGAKGAATPWLAMLNPDAVPDRGWLAALKKATEEHAGVAMVGSTQLCADDPRLLDGAGDNYSIFGIAWRGGVGTAASRVGADIPVFSPCAAAALYRRDAFEEVGGFAETFFCYLEDVDLGFRLRLIGHEAVQCANAKVVHAGSFVSGRYSAFTIFHSTRNGLWLLMRCMPLSFLGMALPLFLGSQVYLTLRMPSTARPRWRGILAGLVAAPRALRERRTIKRHHDAGASRVARWIVWDPRRLSRRDIVPLH